MEPIGNLRESSKKLMSSPSLIRGFQGLTLTLLKMQELDFCQKFHVLESIRNHFP